VTVTRTPLFDLQDRLLGYDCRGFITHRGYEFNATRFERLALRGRCRGLEAQWSPADRGWFCWWYEPFNAYEDEDS